MTGPEIKRFTMTVISMFPNIDWTFEGGGKCRNMIASAFIWDQFQMKIWIDTSRLDGCQCEAELRYEKTSIYQVVDNRGSYPSGVSLDFACLEMKAKLTEIIKAFEITAGHNEN